MFTVTFPEKQVSFDAPLSVYDAAREAGLISREVVGCAVNDVPVDLTHMIDGDASVKLYTFADKEGKHVFWHSASHILAQAMKRLYPDVKLTIGPAIEEGF